MVAADNKQLEDKIAQYERILSGCPRCKAALASEGVELPVTPSVAPLAASSSQQIAPKVSSTASALTSAKPPSSKSRKGQSTRSSNQATTSKSRSGPSTRSRDAVGPSSGSSKQTVVEAGPILPEASSTQQTHTTHSLHLRPTTLNPSASGKDTSPTDTNRLRSIETSRLGPDSNAVRPRIDQHRPPEWISPADKMLSEVPLGWVWHERILGVDKSLLAAVAIETTTVPDEIISAGDTQDKDHLLSLVRDFAHRHSVQRTNFQHFLLVCLCRVLSFETIPQRLIVETLKICISDTSEKNIVRFLRGAQWANEIMDKLFFAGWRYRAIDLLAMCM